MAPNLRAADVAELKAFSGEGPLEALLSAFGDSHYTYCIEHDGEPIAIYGGVTVHEGYIGCPWMLGTDGIKTHWVWFLRHSNEIVESIHKHYRLLINFVDTRNVVHIRWLRWCGFKFGKVRENFGVEGRPFQLFMRFR